MEVSQILIKDLHISEQDCIPVGCVPSTCCPYLPACTALGVPGPGGCLPAPGEGAWFWGCAWSHEVLLRGVCSWEDACLWSHGGGGVTQHAIGQTPPVNRITDTCKHNLAPTSLRAVTIRFSCLKNSNLQRGSVINFDVDMALRNYCVRE